MSKGFSIFTPMIGMIIITITVLIVAAILQDERIVTAGTLQTYQNIRTANIMRNIQSRVLETVRNDILNKWTYHSQIMTSNCFNESTVDKYGDDFKECKKNALTTIKKYILTSMKSSLQSELTKHAIEAMTTAYVDAKISAIDVDMQDIIENAEFVDCENPNHCRDGRVRIVVNFSKIKDKPVAEIKTNTTTLKVYMEPKVREFISDDPIGVYGIKLGELFGNFTLMDETWHGAGNSTSNKITLEDRCDYTGEDTPYGAIKKDGKCYGYGNGSQWYHYKYVFHKRVPPTINNPEDDGNSGYIVTSWKHGFNFSNSKKKPVTLSKKILEYITDCGKSSLRGYESYADLLKFSNIKLIGNFVYEDACSSDSNTYIKDYFSSGYIRARYLYYYNPTAVYSSKYVANESLNEKIWNDFMGNVNERSPMVGGGIKSDLKARYNSLPDDPNYNDTKLQNQPSNFVLFNTTGDYDKKFFSDPLNPSEGRLKETVEAIKKISKDKYKASMGFIVNDPQYNLTVESWQYYVYANTAGGDNWYCGELIGKYIPRVAGYTASRVNNEYGNDAWFYSLPINFSCTTYTMVAVKEKYKLLRNTESHPDKINKTVFVATFKRLKTDYSEGPKETNNKLWKGSKLEKLDEIRGLQEQVPTDLNDRLTIRYCVYSYETKRGNAKKKCEWRGHIPN